MGEINTRGRERGDLGNGRNGEKEDAAWSGLAQFFFKFKKVGEKHLGVSRQPTIELKV